MLINPKTCPIHLKVVGDIVKDQDIGKKNCLALKKRKNFCCNYFIPLIIGKDNLKTHTVRAGQVQGPGEQEGEVPKDQPERSLAI